MRSFAHLDRLIGRVPAEVVTLLRTVEFGRGSEALYRDQRARWTLRDLAPHQPA